MLRYHRSTLPTTEATLPARGPAVGPVRILDLAARCCALAVVLMIPAAGLRSQPYTDPEAANFKIRNLEGINSSEDDYAPFLTSNGKWLYFTTSRTGRAKLVRSLREGGMWGEPVTAPGAGVNSDVDDGVFSAPVHPLAQLYALDDEALAKLTIPTLGVMASGKRDIAANADLLDADLYLFDLTRDASEITNVRPISELNTRDMESQPTISPDGSFIIFVADRSNGDDLKDLYIARRGSDGAFQPAVPIEGPVNSPAREISPFIAPDGKTLFFSSDRAGGFGEADIYVSKMDAAGRWGEPKNLGPLVNTSANELFFFGVGRERCFFVSDRDGGSGGFDIYESAPNIFAGGFSALRVILRDSVTGREIEGHVTFKETTLGRGVGNRAAEPGRPAEMPVASGIGYLVEGLAPGYTGAKRIAIPAVPPDTTITVAINFGAPLPPPPPPPPMVFNIEGINVPLYVSGYYRLNTPVLLDDLRGRQKEGDLKGLTYIADVTSDAGYRQYATMARSVNKTLEEFLERCTKEYFPSFMKVRAPGEILEVSVHGFADPRPIIGNYMEPSASFYDAQGKQTTVATGEALDNFKLAGLRAHYAAQYLDKRLRELSPSGEAGYASMMDQGLIRWRAVSGSVDDATGGDLSQKRRIQVDFRRVPGGR